MNIETSAASALAARGVRYAGEIATAALHHGIAPSLLAAVAAQETGGPGTNAGRNVIGDGGHGHGLFQIDDRWHAFASSAAAMDPARNADYAARLLSTLLQRFGGDVRKALSAYNAGSPTASGTETRWADGRVLGYADSVLRHAAALDDARADAAETTNGVNALSRFAGMLQPLPLPHVDNAHAVRDKQIDYSSLLAGDNE